MEHLNIIANAGNGVVVVTGFRCIPGYTVIKLHNGAIEYTCGTYDDYIDARNAAISRSDIINANP